MNMDLRGKVKFLTGGDGSFLNMNEPQPATRYVLVLI